VELIMKTRTTMHRNALLGLAFLVLPACAAYKIEPPVGFAVVSENDWQTRMKAQDNVGLTLQRFENVKGGTLAFWGADLVKKLGNRGYSLIGQSAVKTKNGKIGTRFDFDYAAYDTGLPKFYTAVLVVTDKEKIVLQVAGDQQYAASYRPRIPELLQELVVRGCKAGSDICKGEQPPPLATPPANKPVVDPPVTTPDPAAAKP
jgi:hypothetical protein